MGRHVKRLEFLDVMLGDRAALTPVESFYQRMLAGDADEAQDHADLLLKECSLSTYYDEVALKGLQLAANDAQRGSVDGEQLGRVKTTVTALVDGLKHHDDKQPPVSKADDGVAGLPDAERDLPHNPDPESVPEGQLPVAWQDPRKVLCIAGRGALDEAAATMLVQLLGKHGMGARVVDYGEVSREGINSLRRERCGDGVHLLPGHQPAARRTCATWCSGCAGACRRARRSWSACGRWATARCRTRRSRRPSAPTTSPARSASRSPPASRRRARWRRRRPRDPPHEPRPAVLNDLLRRLSRTRYPAGTRYGVVVLAIGLTTLLRLVAPLDTAPFLLYMPIVFLVAIGAGWGAALAGVVLSDVLAAYFFLHDGRSGTLSTGQVIALVEYCRSAGRWSRSAPRCAARSSRTSGRWPSWRRAGSRCRPPRTRRRRPSWRRSRPTRRKAPSWPT